ncbi:MAG: hypothetical protein HOI95_27295 [Chromatiales bacterium]|jgi:hypothetical protein|nr:hypothetical protein [Chromatiales bacterium]
MSGQGGHADASGALSLRDVLANAIRVIGHWPLDADQRQVSAHILYCRTPALGGVLVRCSNCEGEQIRYHSCRDRHCPQCQGRASAAWAERQQAYTPSVRLTVV